MGIHTISMLFAGGFKKNNEQSVIGAPAHFVIYRDRSDLIIIIPDVVIAGKMGD